MLQKLPLLYPLKPRFCELWQKTWPVLSILDQNGFHHLKLPTNWLRVQLMSPSISLYFILFQFYNSCGSQGLMSWTKLTINQKECINAWQFNFFSKLSNIWIRIMQAWFVWQDLVLWTGGALYHKLQLTLSVPNMLCSLALPFNYYAL